MRMKLIARKPCSFGGKKYFIGDEIPSEEVIHPKTQERLGVLAILETGVKEEKQEIDADTAAKKARKKPRQNTADTTGTEA